MPKLGLVLSCIACAGGTQYDQISSQQRESAPLASQYVPEKKVVAEQFRNSLEAMAMLLLRVNAVGARSPCGPRRRTSADNFDRCRGVSSASMSVEPIEFFTLEMCPYAQRVWITLEELGIPYMAKVVDVRGADRDWYTATINPRGKVPAIREPSGLVVYESLICMEYLAEQFNTGTLMPSMPADRARMRLWNEHLDTQLAPAHFTLLMNKDKATASEKRAALEDALAYYEEYLVGPYLLGDEFTLADVAALPFFERLVFSLRHFKEYTPLEYYPRTAKWLKRVMERPSVAKTLRPEDKLREVYERFLSMDYAFGGLNKN